MSYLVLLTLIFGVSCLCFNIGKLILDVLASVCCSKFNLYGVVKHDVVSFKDLPRIFKSKFPDCVVEIYVNLALIILIFTLF